MSSPPLARFVRATPLEVPAGQQLDFCNAFWSADDAGLNVLSARMRGATRTMEALRNFWKERSTLEEEYGKRLAQLAASPVGEDEIGDMRGAFDALRLETAKQAGAHTRLAQLMRADLEGHASAFGVRLEYHLEVCQANIELKARERAGTWQAEWKTFCDACQDLEEERMEAIKDDMWAYSNAVSTACVEDDESCENVRLALERVDVSEDLAHFTREYGTGIVDDAVRSTQQGGYTAPPTSNDNNDTSSP